MSAADPEPATRASTPDPEPECVPAKDSPAVEHGDADAEGESQQPVASSSTPPAADPSEWQAVWSPAHNAYYFFNTRTQETTWVNPLQPPESTAPTSTALVRAAELPVASTSTSTRPAETHDPYAAALAAGIDPELAHLDPTLALPSLTPSGPMAFAAKFNARTGAFAKTDARTPEHLGEWERARRMSEMYFDVNKWEQEVAERKEQERQDELDGKKRKRPSKKDLERFKEQKKRKTIAKTAWLRS